jgi:D-3-phosphoglycerate dehydrogenase
MQVVVTDYTFADLSIEEQLIVSSGFTLKSGQAKTPEELIPLVKGADAVITQFAPVNATVIESMERAKVIVRYGIGVDSVDLKAAHAMGIPVCNVPDYCIDEVADHTLAFLLASTRQVVPHSVAVHSGKWGLATPISGFRALRDMTVGVIGFGRIGREVAARLKPFKCRVMIHDPVVDAEKIELAGYEPASLASLLKNSDAVTLHCPSMESTRGLIGHETLAEMKDGAILINLARGDLVQPDALVFALKTGKLAGAALDVFSPEPIPAGHPILSMENVILAPHIASVSVPAVKKLRETAAQLALMAIRGEKLPNVVNGVVSVCK